MAKKTPVKKMNKQAPVMEHKCMCGSECQCHKHGSMHIIKHIIVWAIIFALGMACGKMMNCGHGKKMQRKMHPVFTNGCLDMRSVNCPKLAADIVKADVNGDNCISVEEYKAFKQTNKNFRNKKMRGFKANK
jgi:hypothetical protein